MAEEKGNLLLAIIVGILFVAIVGFAGFISYKYYLVVKEQPKTTACTMEAKICSDGSAVGRVGPDCEFAPCPEVDQTADWQTYLNNEYGFEFKYPNNFFDQSREPKVLFGDCDYNNFPDICPNIYNIISNEDPNTSDFWSRLAAQKMTINNNNYCLYQTGEGAMGHSYYYDYYATVKNNKCVVVFLSTSTTNCQNYLPIEQGNIQQQNNYNACLIKNEQRPKILETILSTFKFTN